MKNFQLSVLASALLFSTFSNAGEQPQAQDLVGKGYGGFHLSFLKPDEDRLNGINDDFDISDGIGFEAGFRLTESTEFRFSYTDLSIEFEKANDNDGEAISLDLLYFPTQKNVYVLGGMNKLQIGTSELSANLGLGYRHYFAENFAGYVEAKAHYQFDESYIDQTAQIGLIFFFGDSAKPATKPAPVVTPTQAAPVTPAVAPKDNDKDGIVDTEDKCLSTPMNDKVDASGCTVFTDKELSKRLLINFDNNKLDIKGEYLEELESLVKFLNQYPHTSVTIEGHTSSQGNAEYNQKLSQKRAENVVDLLTRIFLIDKSRLTAKGYGETLLINPDNTAEAHAENRRIEANVSVTEKVRMTR